MAERNLYLSAVSPEEAYNTYSTMLEQAGFFKETGERISTYDALGRITFKSIYANCCSPLYNSAAMDGIAVIAAETDNASRARPPRSNPGSVRPT